ncbi:MAG: helix-turn-helix domain-containing protein [Solirubrobacteraceae bacterium]
MTSEGEVLRRARERYGIDQRTLARRAGTSQAQVSRIERGETSPSVETLARLLAAMGERLELRSTGLHGNQTMVELRADYELLTTGERLAQASRLSRTVAGIAAGRRG